VFIAKVDGRRSELQGSHDFLRDAREGNGGKRLRSIAVDGQGSRGASRSCGGEGQSVVETQGWQHGTRQRRAADSEFFVGKRNRRDLQRRIARIGELECLRGALADDDALKIEAECRESDIRFREWSMRTVAGTAGDKN